MAPCLTVGTGGQWLQFGSIQAAGPLQALHGLQPHPVSELDMPSPHQLPPTSFFPPTI